MKVGYVKMWRRKCYPIIVLCWIFSYYLKAVEWVVVKQLTFHLESENLVAPLKSVCCKNHSTAFAFVDEWNARIHWTAWSKCGVRYGWSFDTCRQTFGSLWHWQRGSKFGPVLCGKTITVCVHIRCVLYPDFFVLLCSILFTLYNSPPWYHHSHHWGWRSAADDT